jgi:hypothetical protein
MYTTPGVYFETVDRSRPAVGPLRTDIAAFAGYAERGPLHIPVKVTGWRQFTAIFGGVLPDGYLAYAVRGFFENGGAACHVVRVADPDAAKTAAALLPGADGAPSLRVFASYGELHDAATDAPQVDAGHPVRYENPGAWANRLSVSVQPASLGATRPLGSQPADGLTTYVAGLSGFQAGSIVAFRQRGLIAEKYRRVQAIDPHRKLITWDTPIAGLGMHKPGESDISGPLDLSADFDLETVEFSLFVHLDGQIVERHLGMSISPEHSRYVVDALRAASYLLDVEERSEWKEGAWREPKRWPADADRVPLLGGFDGVATVDKYDFLAALDALAKVDEVSLLAAPDLVLRPTAPTVRLRAQTELLPCKTLEPPPQGRLRGIVVERRGDTDVPLAGVRVQALESALPSVLTGADGTFTLEQLPIGRVTVILKRDGYYGAEVTTQSRLVLPMEAARFYMTPIAVPPALPLDDIFDVQDAMIRQGERGLYRVALLDPPPEMLSMENIQTWRARFDSAYGALYYPWLVITREDGVEPAMRSDVIQVPPSGHVAGLIARTDLDEGVHRAPANNQLSGVKALTELVDDAQHGILNPLHINCLRLLPGRGIRVYGARTLSSDPEWRYLNVRRLVSMIEEAMEDASQWVVFEPNNQILRQALTFSLNGFLNTLWRQGALAGDAPEAAYQVKCDEDNNPSAVIDGGQIIAEIGVAPTIPFEFIRFRLGRTVEAVEITE